jgi:AcrR family transcriptional regulator
MTPGFPNDIRNTIDRMVAVVPGEDRRQRRRRETVDEILRAALDAMAQDGVAGMSLSDVARRVGLRPPSLYEYFPNKLALYDALFEIGYRRLTDTIGERTGDPALPPLEALRTGQTAFVDWSMENPVPGFRPSARAFAVSIASIELVRTAIARAVASGDLGPAALSEEAFALFSVVGSGLITQQLANDPAAAPAEGRFSRHTAAGLDMWIARYSPTRREDP